MRPVTRRSVLIGTGAVLLGACDASPSGNRQSSNHRSSDHPSSDGLRALPSSALRTALGVNVHNMWQNTPYSNTAECRSAVRTLVHELGASFFRDGYQPDDPEQQEQTPLLAGEQVQYYAVIGSKATSLDQVRADIDALVREYPHPSGVFRAIAGANEPSTATAASRAYTIERQRALYEKVRSISALDDIPVVSPVLYGNNIAGLRAFASTDVATYADVAAIHHYPGAGPPTADRLTEKIATARRAYPGKPVVMSEFGYVTPNPALSAAPVPEWVCAAYVPRALVVAISRGLGAVAVYELLNQSNRRTLFRGNFGLVETDALASPDLWRRKQHFYSLARLIRLTRDDGDPFTPDGLRATITGDPQHLVLGRRDGRHAILHWRDVEVYDPSTRSAASIDAVTQTVTFPRPRRVTITDVTSGRVTDKGTVSSYTVPVAGHVLHAAID